VKDDISRGHPDLLQAAVKFTSSRIGVRDSWPFKTLLEHIREWLRLAGSLKEISDLTSKFLDLLLKYDETYNSWDDYVFCLEQYVRASSLFPHMHPLPRGRYTEALYSQLRMCGRLHGDSWFSVEKVYAVWDKFDASAWPDLEEHIRGQWEEPDEISGKDKAMLDYLCPSGDYRKFLPR
jgi:hypothetical protein